MDAPRPGETRRAASGAHFLPHRWTKVDDPGTPAVIAAYSTVIAGAGPAGLTAAYELTKHGHACVVLESDPVRVGGISRTDVYKGYRFDIGGHRFFSKSDEVNRIWREILGDELLTRSRISRIYYDRKFFHYPLKPFDALWKLGPWRSTLSVLSYLKARLRPIRPERSYEDWVVNRFGRMLFEIFFKAYTEKVWGMSTSAMSADWAAQRIKGLSLFRAVWNAFFGGRGGRGGEVVKTLIDRFAYPRLGPGQMWERAREIVEDRGGSVHLERRVRKVEHDGGAVTAFVATDRAGREYRYHGKHFVSTLPLRELMRALDPPPPPEVLEAAGRLKYRDFLTVVLIIDREEMFADNWIYIHEPRVRVGRIQNFKNWSPSLVPDPSKTSLGLEYFCFEGDDLWSMADEDLVALGRRELESCGLARGDEVIDGCVVRMPKAYPVYDEHYQGHLAVIRAWLAGLGNLELAGRNGMHKYNNQDHSMMTAVLAARNILGLGSFDTWKVNTDAEYHEEERTSGKAGGDATSAASEGLVGRATPRRIDAA
ncbi:MAG: NAD(P)/FAD-dependent oxidoreductase [Planctomycetota bacterium]|nr:NAD(P)/FAD-dependent oxidoreductase [Planctomycetota bacterium]